MEGEPQGGGGSGPKAFLTRKIGPLPTWAWMGLILGAALAFSAWRSNRQGTADTAGKADVAGSDLGSAYDPYLTFVSGDNTTITNVQTPPGGGRDGSIPAAPAGTPAPVVTAPAPTTTAPKPATPVKKPAAPAPAGRYVPVVAYKKGQKAGTPSTLWGIAQLVYGNAHGAQWKQIWAAPQNAKLRALRKQPELIRPGDSVWVPTK